MNKYVLSKRFMLKFFSSAKLFLVIFLLGSSVFVSGFSFPVLQNDSLASGQIISVSKDSEKKDLSVFVDRLSTRLQGVFSELLGLSSQYVSRDKLAVSSNTQQENIDISSLVDVKGSMYERDIMLLADINVIDSSHPKFYPDNYLRRYEMAMMLVKYMVYQEKNSLPQILFPSRWWFADVAQNAIYAPYVAYAEQQWRISSFIAQKDQKKYFSPNAFVSRKDVCEMMSLSCKQEASEENISRGEFVHVLVTHTFQESTSLSSDSWTSLLSTLTSVFALAK